MTIEERAKELYGRLPIIQDDYITTIEEALKEQKAIDDAELEKIVSSWKEEEEHWIKKKKEAMLMASLAVKAKEKELIDKACEWLTEEGHKFQYEDMVSAFRKYMEE